MVTFVQVIRFGKYCIMGNDISGYNKSWRNILLLIFLWAASSKLILLYLYFSNQSIIAYGKMKPNDFQYQLPVAFNLHVLRCSQGRLE